MQYLRTPGCWGLLYSWDLHSLLCKVTQPITNNVSHWQVTGIPEACTREWHTSATWAWCYQMPGLSTMEPQINKNQQIWIAIGSWKGLWQLALILCCKHSWSWGLRPWRAQHKSQDSHQRSHDPGHPAEFAGPAHLKPAAASSQSIKTCQDAPGHNVSCTIFTDDHWTKGMATQIWIAKFFVETAVQPSANKNGMHPPFFSNRLPFTCKKLKPYTTCTQVSTRLLVATTIW